jgi:hypothetical protein
MPSIAAATTKSQDFYFELPIGAPADSRARYCFHCGTYTEFMYSLIGYGIPKDAFPSMDGASMETTNLNRWIAKYIARDKELAKNGGRFSGIDLPARNNVMAGAGKPIQQHSGNINLRVQVEDFLDGYVAASQLQDQVDVVYRAYLMIQSRSGRFLQKDDDGWWPEIPRLDAIDKVRLTFHRTRRKTKNLPQDALIRAMLDNVELSYNMESRLDLFLVAAGNDTR